MEGRNNRITDIAENTEMWDNRLEKTEPNEIIKEKVDMKDGQQNSSHAHLALPRKKQNKCNRKKFKNITEQTIMKECLYSL